MKRVSFNVNISNNNVRNKIVDLTLFSKDYNTNLFEANFFDDEENFDISEVEVKVIFVIDDKKIQTEVTKNGNKAIFKLDTRYISKSSTINGYIYLLEEDKSRDVYAFSFNAKVSEIDKVRKVKELPDAPLDINIDIIVESVLSKINVPNNNLAEKDIEKLVIKELEKRKFVSSTELNSTKNDLNTKVDERVDGMYQQINGYVDQKFNDLTSQYSTKEEMVGLGTEINGKISTLGDNLNSKINAVKNEYLKKKDLPDIQNIVLSKTNEVTELFDSKLTELNIDNRFSEIQSEISTKFNESKDEINNSITQQMENMDFVKKSDLPKRRPPLNWYIDRGEKDWSIVFDNGCTLILPSYNKTATVLGVGYTANMDNTEIPQYPILPGIIKSAKGIVTETHWKGARNEPHVYYDENYKLSNPVRNKDDYDWSNASFGYSNAFLGHRQKVVIKLFYELGIWGEKVVESLGAVKK